MTRGARHALLETRIARAEEPARPYFVKIAKGLRLGYYRGAASGSWIARCYRGGGAYATEPIGLADDTLRPTASRSSTTGRHRTTPGGRWGERQRLIA
jgi:hypothetical protein